MKNIFKNSAGKTNKDFKRKTTDYVDFGLIGIILLLIIAGLISIYSATFDSGSSKYFYKQLLFSGFGIGVIAIVMFIPEKWLRFNSIFIYLISIAFLAAVLFLGKTVSGTKGWFQYGSISFQPAEFAKIATLLLVARFLSRKGIDIQNLRDVLTVIALFAAPTILIIMQPDMGSASVMMILLAGILFWAGFDLFILYFLMFIPFALILSLLGLEYFIGSILFFAVTSIMFKRKIFQTITFVSFIFIIGYFSNNIIRLMPHNTQDRIETFLNPQKDPLNKGYNVMQSVLAVGSGGITGKGYLKGSQTQLRYIPEQRTDFIFCVPTEEFGFVGGVIVIGFYMLLLFRIIKIASETNSTYFGIISFGVGVIFLYHVVINIGMVMRLVPVMGIPLPFMSYGGTALLVNMGMVGLLLNAYRYRKKLNF